MRRLEVFGSAARGVDFDPERSDVDFLYELSVQPGADYADAYFGLLEGLEIRRHIDLIEPTVVENPFMKAGIDRSREGVIKRDPRMYLWDVRVPPMTSRPSLLTSGWKITQRTDGVILPSSASSRLSDRRSISFPKSILALPVAFSAYVESCKIP